jgi:hypothetical protein
MSHPHELPPQPENIYTITVHQFKDLLDFKASLMEISGDERRDLKQDWEILWRHRRIEDRILAGVGDLTSINGSLIVSGGLALGLTSEDASRKYLVESLLQQRALPAEELPGVEVLLDYLAVIKTNLPQGSQNQTDYNQASKADLEALRIITDKRIARGESSAMALRLLGTSTYWSATTDPQLRSDIEVRIAAEYIR